MMLIQSTRFSSEIMTAKLTAMNERPRTAKRIAVAKQGITTLYL